MMRLKDVMSLPVLLKKTERKIGNIKDVIINKKNKALVGFILERKGTEFIRKMIYFNDILEFCREHITCDKYNIIKWRQIKNKKENILSKELFDMDIIDKDRKWIGYTYDIYFDEQNGKVRGIEVSDGLIEDIIKGRRRMPVLGSVEFSEEFIIAGLEAIEEMSRSGKGIKNLLEKNSEKEDFKL